MVRRPLFYTLGIVSVILGIIGALLPVLPTTPFAILAAYFFSKSSPRMHHWILNLKYIGPQIQEWERHKVIRPKAKLMCMVTIFAMFGSTLIFVRTYTWAKVSMVLVGIGVSVFVLTRKSYPDSINGESNEEVNTHIDNDLSSN